MASFNSPEWITTCAYTYRPPNITPGYTGYFPATGFGYGDTFGNVTAEQFQSRRDNLLLSSNVTTEKEFLPPLEKFPTVYSNDPTLVLADRKRSRERWLASEKYTRTNERAKEQELQVYLKQCQNHREHYLDRTGTVKRVDEFLLPKLRREQLPNFPTTNTQLPLQTSPYTTPPGDGRPLVGRFHGNIRDRAIRDCFFERR